MKFSRYFILFLSLHFFVFLNWSCKNDSTSIDKSTEKDTVENNLIQNEINTSGDIYNDVNESEASGSRQVIENTEEKFDESKKTVKKVKASKEVIIASPEFKTFMEAVIRLSNESTTEELNYVNSFMEKNGLWKEMRRDQCNLLTIGKIKSDPKVLNFWEKRCNFNKAQNKVVNKFNISYGELGKLMQEKRFESQYNPEVEVPNN